MTPTFSSRYPSLQDIREAVEQAHSGSVLEGREFRTETTLIIRADAIRDVCTYLRDDAGWRFNLLADIAGVDWPERERRFDVVYNLYSIVHNHRLRLKVQVGLDESIPSVVPVWSTANWLEREVFDMFGVPFDGHPDLRRILMPDAAKGLSTLLRTPAVHAQSLRASRMAGRGTALVR